VPYDAAHTAFLSVADASAASEADVQVDSRRIGRAFDRYFHRELEEQAVSAVATEETSLPESSHGDLVLHITGGVVP
jgi:hypothetical protein